MKKITLLFALLFTIQLFFGQEKLSEEKIQIGLPYPVVDARTKQYFTYKDLIIGVKIDGKKFYLQTFSTQKLTLEKVKVYEDFPKGFQIERFIKLKDRIYFFYSLWDRSKEKEQLFVREINPEECSFIGKGKKALEVPGKLSGSMIRKGFYGFGVANKFALTTSFDESKLFVQYRKKPITRNDSKSYDVIGMFVYDENMENVWGDDIKMPYTEEEMDNIEYTMDSKGNVFLLAYVRNMSKKPIESEMRLIKFFDAEADFDGKIIEFPEGKGGNNLSFFEDSDGSILLAGYSGDNEVAKINLGEGDEDVQFDYYDIPVDVINQNLRKRKVKKNKKKESKDQTVGLDNLVPRSIYLHNDGSMFIIGEQYFSVTTTTTDANGNTRTTTTYYYQDILVTKINKDGSLAWMKKLPKRQSGRKSRGSMSFKLVEGESDLYFVYMDNIKNLMLGDIEEPESHRDGKGGFLTAYKVDYLSGDVKRISLLDSRNIKEMKMYQFTLSRISSVVLDEFVFEVYKKKKEDVLIKVELK
jgi:hypothetical protein